MPGASDHFAFGQSLLCHLMLILPGGLRGSSEKYTHKTGTDKDAQVASS